MKTFLLLLTAAPLLLASNQPPIIFQKSINIDDKWQANVVIREGEEPADAIFSALRPYGVNHIARRSILDEVKKASVPLSKEFATVFSQHVVLQDDSFSGTFTLYDDGSEPIDVLYNFAKAHSIEPYFGGLTESLLPKLCELIPCGRRRPRIWFNDITSDDGKKLGALEILEGDEAADTVDTFVRKISVDIGDRRVFRENLLAVICKSIACSRRVPVIFRKAIKDQHGNSNGAIEIFEDEEVIDAVVRFIRKSKLALDEIALRNYMLQQACGIDRLKCTRNVGMVYNQRITTQDGSPINTLTIFENEEPADAVYKWCQQNKVVGFMESIMDSVCGSDLVTCNRREPVYFSIPISGPEGDYVNTLELKVGHEPVDDMYGFFAANGLFKKEWDFQGVVKQICARPDVDCRRTKAVKYLDNNFTMGGEELGQVVIWEDEEVVDALYNIRKNYNLTKRDQIEKFNEICKEAEIECKRTRAVVYKKTDITMLEYEQFGNETCKRQYVGVKFRSTFVDLPFGSKLSELLKKDAAKEVIEHPLFCVVVFVLLLLSLHAVTSIPRIKAKVHPSQKAVASFWLVFLVSVLQSALVEPDDAVDKEMHVYEGLLPDLIIYEDDEPVDALLKWSKDAAFHQVDPATAQGSAEEFFPIAREPIYYEILDELCKTEGLTCNRTRAWEFLNVGAMTFYGNEYAIDLYNPNVNPNAQNECYLPSEGKTNVCLEKVAARFCERLWPAPDNCAKDITTHIVTQLQSVDDKRLDAKCSYKRLGLEMDAPAFELYKKAASVALSRRMNMSPFRRVDNGTLAFDTWSKETSEAHTAIDTFQKIHDPESRQWNDKPCVPYFGGSLCAKTDKDGNMLIEV